MQVFDLSIDHLNEISPNFGKAKTDICIVEFGKWEHGFPALMGRLRLAAGGESS